MTLNQIINAVSKRMMVHPSFVQGIVQETMEEIVRCLDAGQELKIRGLGRWRWRPIKQEKIKTWTGETLVVPEGRKLKFYPARPFRSRRCNVVEKQEEGMTKLGVQLDDQKTKTASTDGKGRTCPLCKRALDDFGACPEHGTEPFEPSK